MGNVTVKKYPSREGKHIPPNGKRKSIDSNMPFFQGEYVNFLEGNRRD